MTITISPTAFTLSGPLVAGGRVGVSVSGFTFAEGVAPVLALQSRFPAALLASVQLAADEQTSGTWTGELDTATKQTAAFMFTARADERRDALLELVAGRESLARIAVPLVNSALCPKLEAAPCASPVYIPVPGPQGEPGTPGPLRGRQYAYTVADGDEIALPADAASVVLDLTSGVYSASIRIVPPTLAEGTDFSFFLVAGFEEGTVEVTIYGTSFFIGIGDVLFVQKISADGVAVRMLERIP